MEIKLQEQNLRIGSYFLDRENNIYRLVIEATTGYYRFLDVDKAMLVCEEMDNKEEVLHNLSKYDMSPLR